MKTVSNHQFGGGYRSCDKNLLTLRGRDFKGLFREHMDAGFERRDDELSVPPVRCRQIDGVKGSGTQGLLKLLIAECCVYAVFLPSALAFVGSEVTRAVISELPVCLTPGIRSSCA